MLLLILHIGFSNGEKMAILLSPVRGFKCLRGGIRYSALQG